MTKLDKLLKLNKQQKLNRKNTLKEQQYYGEIKRSLDPPTKTLNANNEQNIALGE